MRKYKHQFESVLLRRNAHLDVFELGQTPEFLFLLFGGSGIDEEVYWQRSTSIIPVFNNMLAKLEDKGLQCVFVHATAPFDIPFNRFPEESHSRQIWNKHVRTEIVNPWSKLPMIVGGFSGGATLAFSGLHDERNCVGGAVFGADALPVALRRPSHWHDKLRWYATPEDRVCNAQVNRRVIETLVSRDDAEQILLDSGGHSLADYANSQGIGDAITNAKWSGAIDGN